MKNRFEIIETPDYILAVSDEEIKEGDICLKEMPYYGKHIMIAKGIGDIKSTTAFWRKIIAYRPKNNAVELDLPLLPEIVVKDDVEKLAKEEFKGFEDHYDKWRFGINGFIKGYNAATKVYGEDDLYVAFNVGRTYEKSNHEGVGQSELIEYIQSLRQPKTPKWFVAEMETAWIPYGDDGWKTIDTGLKTRTINGKNYVVGTYEYE